MYMNSHAWLYTVIHMYTYVIDTGETGFDSIKIDEILSKEKELKILIINLRLYSI